jgi:hypothetical protein
MNSKHMESIWSPRDLYKPLAHRTSTINRRRPTAPLRALDFRDGLGDAKCFYEVTGGFAVDDHGPSLSMRDVCAPILQADPSSRMGDYLNCMGDYMKRGSDACGFSYQKDLRPENYNAQRNPGFTSDMVFAPRYYYPSAGAFNAAYKRYDDLEREGYGCWTKQQMSPSYTYNYGL